MSTDENRIDKHSDTLFFSYLQDVQPIQGDVLDMFARDGYLTVSNYAYLPREVPLALDLWEMSPEHEQALRMFQPRQLHLGCSYWALLNVTPDRQYDVVVIDSPQGIHHDVWGVPHVEHFDALKGLLVNNRLKDECTIIVFLNLRPYNPKDVGEHGYDKYDDMDFDLWMDKRRQYYGSQNVDLPQALQAYRGALQAHGYDIAGYPVTGLYQSKVPGVPAHALRLAMKVKRT